MPLDEMAVYRGGNTGFGGREMATARLSSLSAMTTGHEMVLGGSTEWAIRGTGGTVGGAVPEVDCLMTAGRSQSGSPVST